MELKKAKGQKAWKLVLFWSTSDIDIQSEELTNTLVKGTCSIPPGDSVHIPSSRNVCQPSGKKYETRVRSIKQAFVSPQENEIKSSFAEHHATPRLKDTSDTTYRKQYPEMPCSITVKKGQSIETRNANFRAQPHNSSKLSFFKKSTEATNRGKYLSSQRKDTVMGFLRKNTSTKDNFSWIWCSVIIRWYCCHNFFAEIMLLFSFVGFYFFHWILFEFLYFCAKWK